VLEELPAVGATPTASYTIGSQLISQEKGGTNSYLMADGHGSTRLLTDTNGVISDRYSYDAYGVALDFTFGTLNPPRTAMLYSGERFDSDLQQYYLRARYYNPTVGRFGTMDQLDGTPTDPLSLHKYAYCQNNPVNGRDPSGNDDLASLTMAMSIGASLDLAYNGVVTYFGSKLLTEATVAGESLQQIEGQPVSPDVDTATIIVHGLNGVYNGQPIGWSKDYQADLKAKDGTPVQQKGGSGKVNGAGLNQDFYEFDWGGMSFDSVGLIPIKAVHEMAFVHLQMAQMLVWMKGYNNINIISHSWGTLLSYDLLNSGGIEMHDWVTMGSPLKKTTGKPVWVTGNWINCFSYYDPVTHFEIYPPYECGVAMLPSVAEGMIWGRLGKTGDGLTVDPNVDINHLPYTMGLKDFDEHGNYWKWVPCLNDIRKDLQ
jgi:RHS repeat-associated protein